MPVAIGGLLKCLVLDPCCDRYCESTLKVSVLDRYSESTLKVSVLRPRHTHPPCSTTTELMANLAAGIASLEMLWRSISMFWSSFLISLSTVTECILTRLQPGFDELIWHLVHFPSSAYCSHWELHCCHTSRHCLTAAQMFVIVIIYTSPHCRLYTKQRELFCNCIYYACGISLI